MKNHLVEIFFGIGMLLMFTAIVIAFNKSTTMPKLRVRGTHGTGEVLPA
jgi:hypothetical protein